MRMSRNSYSSTVIFMLFIKLSDIWDDEFLCIGHLNEFWRSPSEKRRFGWKEERDFEKF